MARRNALRNCTPGQTTNAALWLNKYPATLDRKKDPEGFSRIFDQVTGLAPSPSYKLAYARRQAALQQMGAVTLEAKSLERIIVGLGDESTLETSITLLTPHGVPYLPGSALKGLASSYAHQELEGWNRSGEAYQTLFGADSNSERQQAGCVVFQDAWPHPQQTRMHIDVINTHHPDYYQNGNSPPADWDSPVPINFLTTSGSFTVALSGPAPEWVRAAAEILRMALDEYGIGAKTNRGYGRMKLESAPAVAAKPKPAQLDQLLSALASVKDRDRGSFNQTHVEKWKKLPEGPDKKAFGKAILERVKELGWQKDWATKPWYVEIQRASE